jgi:hypothetical protein
MQKSFRIQKATVCAKLTTHYFPLINLKMIIIIFAVMAGFAQTALNSWLNYSPDTHFPLENLPYGIFKHPESQ